MAQLTLYSPTLFEHSPSVVYVPLLDRFLYRHPFEGGSARRYVRDERPAFGDLDARLLDELDTLGLPAARTFLDLGCGPGTFVRAAAARHPHLQVIAVDPSRDFACASPDPRSSLGVIRAAGEALPLASGSVDFAICLSSIRHVSDRAATLRELRRVVRGRLLIVELDPAADARRIATHAAQLGSALLRRAFGPLVVRTAPPAPTIAALAVAAGWVQRRCVPDPIQPVYLMELA